MINVQRLGASIGTELKRIGGCPFCITQSLRAAALSTVVFLFAAAISPLSHSMKSVWITGGVAAAFAALWLLHIVVYGVRAARFARQESVPPLDARRRFLATFGKATVGVAAVAGMSLIWKPAYAQQTCTDGTACNPGSFCCYWGDTVYCCPDQTHCSGNQQCVPNQQ